MPGPAPTGLQILQGILQHAHFLEADAKPAIVVLPEFALPFADVAAARTLIANAPLGTLVVFGIGQMTEAQALSIEDKPDLWHGTADGRFANCAAVGVGGVLQCEVELVRSERSEQRTFQPLVGEDLGVPQMQVSVHDSHATIVPSTGRGRGIRLA